MKKFVESLKRDLWVILLDIIAVNLSYYLALIVRFFVGGSLRAVAVERYMPAWQGFTPFYTILAIAIFLAFRLYGGLWRYAGINDMNRIILANICTTVIHILGTAIFFTRMPWTYYLIGAVTQFVLVVIIRFSYRALLVEKKKISSRNIPTVPTLIIGAGETGRKILKHMEDSAFKPVAILDEKNAGKSLDGIPVMAGNLEEIVGKYEIKAIVISHTDQAEREKIKAVAEKNEIELLDYTGHLVNLGGRVPLSALLEISKGRVTIDMDGKETVFENGEAALKAINDRYDVVRVEDLRLVLKKPSAAAYVGYEAWARQYKEETGNDVSFF